MFLHAAIILEYVPSSENSHINSLNVQQQLNSNIMEFYYKIAVCTGNISRKRSYETKELLKIHNNIYLYSNGVQ